MGPFYKDDGREYFLVPLSVGDQHHGYVEEYTGRQMPRRDRGKGAGSLVLIFLGVAAGIPIIFYLRLRYSRTLIAREIQARGGSVESMSFHMGLWRSEYRVIYRDRTGERRSATCIESAFKVFFADDTAIPGGSC
jgi:hypothetical protein